MSRGGRITLVRPTRAERVQALVADAAREMAPACAQACSFFFQGLADFITTPVAESAESLGHHVACEGARRLPVAFPELAVRFDGLAQAITARAAERQVEFPPVLAVRPPVITASAVRLQEEALRAIGDRVSADPACSLQLNAIAARMEEERRQTQRAFDLSSLVAGRHAEGTTHPVFSGFEALIQAEGDGSAGRLREQITRWAAEERQALHQETAQSWAAVTLAAAKLALEATGLTPETPDLSGRCIAARDTVDPQHRMEVRVAPDTGEVRYELFGYRGGQCQPVEQRFLQALSQMLGAELTPQNVRHWETAPACAAAPAREDGTKLDRRCTNGEAPVRQRERQKG